MWHEKRQSLPHNKCTEWISWTAALIEAKTRLKNKTRDDSGVCNNLRFIFNWIRTQEQTNSTKMKLWKSKKNQNNNNCSANSNHNGNGNSNDGGSTSCVPGKSSNLAKANECNKLDSSTTSSSTGKYNLLAHLYEFSFRVYKNDFLERLQYSKCA